MKKVFQIIITLALTACNNHNMEDNTLVSKDFNAERISKSAKIILNENLKNVFPLFTPFEERKWAEGWNPELIYPTEELVEEGTVFKTKGHGHDENEFLWLISKYQPEVGIIQYNVSTQNRIWTITIKCIQIIAEKKTKAEITYSFTGLNSIGNKINKIALERMFSENLKDWEKAINLHLSGSK